MNNLDEFFTNEFFELINNAMENLEAYDEFEADRKNDYELGKRMGYIRALTDVSKLMREKLSSNKEDMHKHNIDQGIVQHNDALQKFLSTNLYNVLDDILKPLKDDAKHVEYINYKGNKVSYKNFSLLRISNSFKRIGIKTVGELRDMTYLDYSKKKGHRTGISKQTFTVVKTLLEEYIRREIICDSGITE